MRTAAACAAAPGPNPAASSHPESLRRLSEQPRREQPAQREEADQDDHAWEEGRLIGAEAKYQRHDADDCFGGRSNGHGNRHSAGTELSDDRAGKCNADHAQEHQVGGITLVADDADRATDPDEQEGRPERHGDAEPIPAVAAPPRPTRL